MAISTGVEPNPPTAAPTLVGREAECALLHEQVADARAGHGRVVVIGGEAGIGKTTLARVAMQAARGHGMPVLVGHCFDLTVTPPYGLWLDFAAGYRYQHQPAGRGDLPPLPPLLASREVASLKSQLELFDQVRTFFERAQAVQPVLVVLEDVHWADPASLELLRYIGSQVASWRLLLVLTYRVDELSRQHPFYRQLPALLRESEGLRLDLKPLTSADFGALVTDRYGLAPAERGRLVTYLAQHADGNPFFAIELLHALAEAGLLDRHGDHWRVGDLERVVVPTLVQQVIDDRVGRLGEAMRQPLAVASIIGQEVALDLWAQVAGLSEETLLAIVDRVVAAHILAAASDGLRVQFVHALTREALYESVLPPRRRLLHRKVGEALIGRAGSDPDAIAYHLRQAGDRRAPDWLVRAGERAQRAYAWRSAWDRFAAAADMLASVPDGEHTRARLLYRCGRLRRYSEPAQGIADLTEAARLATFVGDKLLAADTIYSRGLVRCFADDWRLGVAEMTVGVEQLEALPPAEARLSWATATWMADALPAIELTAAPPVDPAADRLLDHGVNHRRGSLPWFLAATGRLAEASSMADAFLQLVEGSEAGPLVLANVGHALFGLGMVSAARGEPGDARTAFARARAIYDRIDHHALIAFVYLTELRDVLLPYAATDLGERRRFAAEAQTALARAGGAFASTDLPRRAQLALCFLEGRWADATTIAADDPAFGTYVLRREVTGALAPIAYHQGRVDEAWDHIRLLLPSGPSSEPESAVHLEALMVQRLAVDLSLESGQLDQARAWLEASDRWLAWSGSWLGRAENRLAWARLLRASDDLTQAHALASEAIRLAERPRQALALLAAYRLRGELATALGQFTGADSDLQHALTLADRCAAPFERALTRIAQAELRSAADEGSVAATLLAEARDICLELEARPALARIDALAARLASDSTASARPAGLTPREQEVLRLVAQGLTDAEVADRLFVSPRTVSQHLRSIYGKLAVTSRSGATRFAVERGLA